MILVADRCGMSPTGMAEMKKNILKALEEFVDIESEEQIDVSISLEPEVGTIYCVAVPVRRVKPEARAGFEGEADGLQVLEWDPSDKESDPSSRFPMGC
jgi:septum formation topological specificity factor MinE